MAAAYPPVADVTSPFPSRLTSAVRWATLAQIARQSGQVLSAIVLARIVSPRDVGLIAMAIVATGFVSVIRDLGVGAAVVQRQSLDDSYASTQFWVALLFGTFATLLLGLLAPLVADAYDEPRVTDVTRALALTFVLAGAGVVHQARLERQLRFSAVAVVEIVAMTAGLSAAVLLASSGGGVWSFVAQALVSAAATTAGLWLAESWRPTMTINLSTAAAGSRFGAPLTAFNALNFVARNADYALIGRFLGSEPLGYYTLAYRLMLVPLQTIVSVTNRVMFPALAALQSDRDQARRRYLQSLSGAAFFALPLALSVGASADHLVPAVLGQGWEPAVPVIRILSLVACLQTLSSTVGPIYLAAGRTKLLLAWGAIVTALTVLGFLVGLRWGIIGVAAGYAVTQLIVVYPSLRIPLRLIDIPVSAAISVVRTSFVLSCAAGLVSLAAGFLLDPSRDHFVVLFLQLSLGALVYLGGSMLLNRGQVRLAVAILRGRPAS